MTERVLLQRDYSARPERVFEAWTRIELLERWLGCGPDMLWRIHQWDVRVGGALHVSLQFEAGPFEVRGEFLVVDPPHHLRYRWAGGGIVDVTIEARGTGSRVTVLHSNLATDEERTATTGGWGNSLGQLEQVLAEARPRNVASNT
jgi:glutathione S-transferase